MDDVREELVGLGWVQGSLIETIPDERFKKHSHIALDDEAIYLVISQTCDLLNPDFRVEPYFEVLRLTQLDVAPSVETSGGKNSRVLQFELNLDDESRTYQALPFERFFVERSLLLEFSPERTIDDDARDLIVTWLTKRLIRTAFPDAFDRRWKNRRKQIEKIIKRLTLVKDIYIKIEPFTEIDAGVDYEVEIYLLLDADDFDNPDTHAEYTKHKQDLENQFNQCQNIDLLSIDLTSDGDITLRELQGLRRWDYSYLSYRDPEEHQMPLQID